MSSSSLINKAYFYEDTQLKPHIKLGDFIVRQGTAYESILIKQLSGSPYSHIGLIIQTEPHILIVHATTDDKIDTPNQVIFSTLSEFIHPKLADGWAIYRNEQLSRQDIDSLIKKTKMQLGAPFLVSTQHNNEQGVYCTTLIANHLPQAIYQRLQWQPIDIPGLQGEMLYPKALIDEAIGSKLIYQEALTAP